MFQEITLSSDVFRTVYTDKNLYSDTIQCLKKESAVFVDERSFYKHLHSFLQEAPEKIASLINGQLQVYLEPNIIKKDVVCENLPKGLKLNKNMARITAIAMENGDKILIKKNCNRKQANDILKASNVYVYSVRQYCEPDKNVPLPNPRDNTFREDEPIDPNIILKPYLQITTSISIWDPYPLVDSEKVSHPFPRPFWRDLFRMCKPNTRIRFRTLSDQARKRKKTSTRVTESVIEKELKKICQHNHFRLIFLSSSHDRSWYTDQFNIRVGAGGMLFYKKEDKTYKNGAGEGAYITVVLKK